MMSISDNPFKDFAVKYHEKNLSTIPVAGKAPVISGWQKFSSVLPTDEQFERWVDEYPHLNIGIVCGAASGLVALDIDTDDPEVRAKIDRIIPPSEVIKVGRKGGTLFYRYGGHKSKSLRLHPKASAPVVELLSDKRQSVVPPSVHPQTKKPYYFSTPVDLLDIEVGELPELPIDIMDQLHHALRDHNVDPSLAGTGGRNNILKAQVWAAIAKGKQDEEIAEEIVKYDVAHHNRPLFSDPLEYSEKKSAIENARTFIRNNRRSFEHLSRESADTENKLVFVCAKDITSKEVEFVWKKRIPKGKVTLVEGDPGIGKSSMLYSIAAAISNGYGLPGSEGSTPERVIIFSAEDDLEDTIKPRLELAGANHENVFLLKSPVSLNDPSSLSTVNEALKIHHPLLIIIDPLFAYMDASVDIHKANQTRAVMTALSQLAHDNACAIVCVRHLNKDMKGSKTLYRGIGSIDFSAAARSVLHVARHPREQDHGVVLHIKSNVSKREPTLKYSLTDGKFEWAGECDITEENLYSSPIEKSAPKLEEAMEFLTEFLKDGPIESKSIDEAGSDRGLSRKTLNRAREELQIVARRIGVQGLQGGGVWFWHLPEHADQFNALRRSYKPPSVGLDGQPTGSPHMANKTFQEKSVQNENNGNGAHPDGLD